MGTRVFARFAETTDLAPSAKVIYQPFKTNQNMILRGMRYWVVVYNNPSFSGLTASVWSNNELTSLPASKIADSTNSWQKSQLTSLANGFFEIYQTFDDVPLQEDTTYHFVFNCQSYTGTDASHIGFRIAYPRPVYTDGIDLSPTKINRIPYLLYLIGASF